MLLLILSLFLLSPVSQAQASNSSCESTFSEKENESSQAIVSYEEAQAIFQAHGIRNRDDYIQWMSPEMERHFNLPRNPEKAYKDKWQGWDEFLETDKDISFLFSSYRMAKAIVQEEGIRSRRHFIAWYKYHSTATGPYKIPFNPEEVYKDQWEGWPKFLGIDHYLSYEEAQAVVQAEGIRTVSDFIRWSESPARPSNIPPNTLDLKVIYEDQWEGWEKFLERDKDISSLFLPYKEAQTVFQRQGIRTKSQFMEWRLTSARPSNIPFNPEDVYKAEWEGWENFLGTDKDITFVSYEEAQAIVQAQGIKTKIDFLMWRRTEFRPPNVPFNPEEFYKEEWESWENFLGIEWMLYKEAQAVVKKLGLRNKREFREWRLMEPKSSKMPFNPKKFYKEQWEGWSKFLGLEEDNREDWRRLLRIPGV